MTKIYHYWTDFSPQNSQLFEIMDSDPGQSDWFHFETSLDGDYIHTLMSPRELRIFLSQMWNFYK